jgi:hypothetical protein
MGLDTKTYWLTDRQSQYDFDFDFQIGEFQTRRVPDSRRWIGVWLQDVIYV